MTGEREGLVDPVAAKVTQVLRDRGWLDSGDAADAGPEVAAHLADLLAARDRRVRAEAVWQVSAFGRGRSVDRLCDSLATGQSVCDDLMRQLGGEWSVVEDWANLNLPEALPRWVRYVSRNGAEPVEQVVAAAHVDTSGTWFRDRIEADA